MSSSPANGANGNGINALNGGVSTNGNSRSIKYKVPKMTVDTSSQCPLLEDSHVTPSDEGLINSKLPGELILRIFGFLDVVSLCRCAQVSKFWNSLATDGAVWQNVNLFFYQRDVSEGLVQNIASRSRGFLRILSLDGCKQCTDSSIIAIARHCPQIVELRLDECTDITDAAITAIAKSCAHLTGLSLSSCSSIGDPTLESLAACQQLKFLTVNWCTLCTDTGLQALVEGCKALRVFRSIGCTSITSDGVKSLAVNCKEITTVNLQLCSQITDDAVIALSKYSHELTSLNLSGCTAITDAALIALGGSGPDETGCPKLRILELAKCSLITDAGVLNLAKGCNQLEKLDLEDCSLLTDASLSVLAMNCSKLVALLLGHCELITDEGLKHLFIAQLHQLQDLAVDNCPLVTDASLAQLESSSAFPALRKLDLYDCQHVTRAGIKKLKQRRSTLFIQAYFAPPTPENLNNQRAPQPRRRCRCCTIA